MSGQRKIRMMSLARYRLYHVYRLCAHAAHIAVGTFSSRNSLLCVQPSEGRKPRCRGPTTMNRRLITKSRVWQWFGDQQEMASIARPHRFPAALLSRAPRVMHENIKHMSPPSSKERDTDGKLVRELPKFRSTKYGFKLRGSLT